MTTRITVREYARLTTEPIDNPGLDRAHVSFTVFDWLCQLNESFGRGGASLIQVEGRRWLRLDNYVGVLEAPCGTCLEILPKHLEATDDIAQGRRLLRRMIQAALDLPTREVGTAALELFDAPLSEWVMRQFLEALEHVVKRGVRFDYRRVEEEQPFLRGQLDVVGQMRQPPGKQHHFRIRYDLFGPDRPENRLLKLALERVCKSTQVSSSWRLAHELRGMLSEVPASHDPRQDFRAWRTDRLMAHYQAVRPWCQLILDQTMPIAVAGQQYGMSLLFPMAQLFEQYVARYLERTKLSDTQLKMQAASAWLCRHEGGNFFQLRPDLLLSQGNRCWVLDTKWKRLNAEAHNRNYGLSQADFYQLFAYGHKYLKGQGDVVLIYPAHSAFKDQLEVFEFSSTLKLWVLPFDLERTCLIGAETAGLPISSCK